MKEGAEFWYIRDGDDVAGPFTFAELDERRSRGELGWSQEVSQNRMIWVSASAPTDSFRDDAGPNSEAFNLTELVPGSGHGPGKGGPRRGVPSWVVVGVVAVGLGCLVFALSGTSGGEAEAVLRVLQADSAASKETVNSPGVEKTPSVYARTIQAYVSRMQEVDTSDCPEKFRVAFDEHLERWQELSEAVAAMPDGFVDGFFIGALNGFLRGERDGGYFRMTDAVKKASKGVKASFREVKRVAAGYDVTPP